MEAPRSYSVRDPAFEPEIGRRVEVRLDGDLQRKVIAYDCDAGTLTRYALDEAGKIKINREKREAVEETVAGVVEVRLRDA